MLDNDSEITVERLQEIIELLREFELETPEEIALCVGSHDGSIKQEELGGCAFVPLVHGRV